MTEIYRNSLIIDYDLLESCIKDNDYESIGCKIISKKLRYVDLYPLTDNVESSVSFSIVIQHKESGRYFWFWYEQFPNRIVVTTRPYEVFPKTYTATRFSTIKYD